MFEPPLASWVLGQHGSPLLPSAIADIEGTDRAVPIFGRRRGAAAVTHVSAIDLATGQVWKEVEGLDPLKSAAWALIELMTSGSLGDLTLGQLIGRPPSTTLPLLITTQDWLAAKKPDSLQELRPSSMVETEQDALAVVDLLVTSEGWGPGSEFLPDGGDIESLGWELLTAFSVMLGADLPAPKYVPALLKLWGWSGEAPTTLETAGQVAGVTRERIRQVAVPYRSAVLARSWPVPAELGEALEILRTMGPVSRIRAAQALAARGLTPKGFAVESVLSIGRALGVGDLPVLSDDHLIPTTTGKVASPAGLRRAIRKASNRLGIVHVEAVLLQLASEGVACNGDQLRNWLVDDEKVLKVGPDYVYVEAGRASTLVETSLRQLAVADPLDVRELHEGLVRRARFRQLNDPPPAQVMLDFYRTHDAFEVSDGGLVSKAASYEWKDDPDTVQRAIVDILRAHPGSIAADVDIRAAADSRGIRRASVATYLQYGEQLRRVAPNVYSPVGTSADGRLIDEVIADRRAGATRTEVVHSYDASSDRHVLEILLGTAAAISGVLVLPTEVRAVLPDHRYKLGTASLGLSESFLFGLGPAFNQMMAREGDFLRLTLDPKEKVATLQRA